MAMNDGPARKRAKLDSPKLSLLVHLSCDPQQYRFFDGLREMAELPAGEDLKLDTLRLMSGADSLDFFPLSNLDLSKKYEFRRLEIEIYTKETRLFLENFSFSDFEEVRIENSILESTGAQEFVKRILKFPKLKKLDLRDVVARDCTKLIKDFWLQAKWEYFSWYSPNSSKSKHVAEFTSEDLKTFLNSWRNDPNPRMKKLRLGKYTDVATPILIADDPRQAYYRLREDNKVAIIHSSGRLVAHVELFDTPDKVYSGFSTDGHMVIRVEEMRRPEEMTNGELKTFTKNELIKMYKALKEAANKS
ncbi:hypothetical protein QR680_011664 [Steinernema hermaphroditum]|uniref:Uncharacterized protein n=1 Tax=Steinernema hermaphroditum TaxID=289476 RepID=A0AA39HZC8_9BILA|nr:hypothetical protein QR680_011664 [Steinernema hermaphroditum]